jgi:hypothetical protein
MFPQDIVEAMKQERSGTAEAQKAEDRTILKKVLRPERAAFREQVPALRTAARGRISVPSEDLSGRIETSAEGSLSSKELKSR